MMMTLDVGTSERNQLVDITSQIRKAVRDSGVSDGACLVYVPHTTAAVTINENADPTVKQDILMMLGKLVPLSREFRHAEGNSDAHVKATLVGSSVRVIVESGDILLGRWQGIFFCEFDGPRSRRVHVQVSSNG
jgi:secondary thiamine-phosphate synthase enzyme